MAHTPKVNDWRNFIKNICLKIVEETEEAQTKQFGSLYVREPKRMKGCEGAVTLRLEFVFI